jgi:glycosyltransferase involved in cell wall biosynthesis
LVTTTLLPARWANAARFPFTMKYTQRLENLCRSRGAALIHDHGLWLQSNYQSSLVASRLGLTYCSSPRGTLTRWALEQKKLRKRAAWLIYQKRALERARILFATSEEEAGDFRAEGLKQPIAVVPNGVALGPLRQADSESQSNRVRTMLFLSRLHPKKGVVDLVDAWACVKPAGWRLLIAGPDEGGHRRIVEDRVDALGLRSLVSLGGEISEGEKSELYGSADVFVLPTRSENFGIVVAEALAHGVPVITTTGAPWRQLEQVGAGWWVEPSVIALAEAIQSATSMADAERRAMGVRGRKLVESRYGWNRAASLTKAVYSWAVHGGDRPACVVLD